MHRFGHHGQTSLSMPPGNPLKYYKNSYTTPPLFPPIHGAFVVKAISRTGECKEIVKPLKKEDLLYKRAIHCPCYSTNLQPQGGTDKLVCPCDKVQNPCIDSKRHGQTSLSMPPGNPLKYKENSYTTAPLLLPSSTLLTISFVPIFPTALSLNSGSTF